MNTMSLDREWEKYRGGPTRMLNEVPRVTINRKGLIYMNAKMFQAFGRPKAVAIFYNRAADSIALEPAHARFIENFQVVPKQNGWAVHASSFCRHFGIRVATTERFIRPDVTDQGQLILNLRETVTVGGIVKKRRADKDQDICPS